MTLYWDGVETSVAILMDRYANKSIGSWKLFAQFQLH